MKRIVGFDMSIDVDLGGTTDGRANSPSNCSPGIKEYKSN